MQVQFHQTLADLDAFSSHHYRNAKDVRRRVRLTQVWGLVFAVLVGLMWPRWGWRFRTFFILGYSLFLLFAYPAYFRWLAKRQTRKLHSQGLNRGALGDHIISISPEGLMEISEVGESRTSWDGILRVEEDEGYVFLYTNPFHAHVIPKRAFLSEGESREFFRLAQAYHSGGAGLMNNPS